MSVDFYRAFEDKFRGSRELIQSRLAVYLPFIHPIRDITEKPKALDLGCGRGEWLELLRQEGLDATGVDLDEGMLKACQELELKALKADAISYLEGLPDASVAVVSSFHMVEHISFEALQTLVQQALRVLIPGGLLIMETPNPENLQVGAHTFYYDPTHQRPLPPMLLAFLPEHYGYVRTAILRLQQDPRLDANSEPTLMDVLTGPSPDYAVIAQKAANSAQLSRFDSAFGRHHGLTLHTLAMRYDASRTARLEATARDSQQALSSAATASNVAQQALSSSAAATGVAQQAVAASAVASGIAQQALTNAVTAQEVAQQAFAEARQTRELVIHFEATLQHYQNLSHIAEQRVHSLLHSTSWRITAPFRWMGTALRKLHTLPKRAFRFGARALVLPLMRTVLARPQLRQQVSSVLKRFPNLAHRLHLLAIHRGLLQAPDARPSESPQPPAAEPQQPLTPHAQRIYDQLKKDIAQSKSAQDS